MILRLLSIALAGVSLLAVSACHDQNDEPTQPIGFRAPVRNHPQPTPPTMLPPDELAGEPTPSPRERRERPVESATSATQQGPVDYPYGVPVQGKPGYVTSPYAPDSGYVDVHEFATGQEVRCPYTQKIFLVP